MITYRLAINTINWIWPYLIGYTYAGIVGGFIVKKIMAELKTEIRLNSFKTDIEKRAYSWYSEHIGYIEGISYLTAFIFGRLEFIAVWLAFKVAGRWESAKMEADITIKNTKRKKLDSKTKILNNALYNIFTIGNALVLIYAATSWKIICWLQSNQLDKAFFIGASVILLSFIFNKHAKKQTSRLKKIFSLQISSKQESNTENNTVSELSNLPHNKASAAIQNSLSFLTIILAIVALLPYGLEIYFYSYYRPTLTVDFNPLNLSQDKDGDWFADYSLTITGNRYLVLPKKIFVSYNDHTIVPNSYPNMPGGTIGSIPVINSGSLALIWDCENSVIYTNQSIGFSTRARLKNKKDIIPAQIVIYAEVDPYDLGLMRLFYHSRLYKGVLRHNINFSGKQNQETEIVRLR